jgi:hypothetical protein
VYVLMTSVFLNLSQPTQCNAVHETKFVHSEMSFNTQEYSECFLTTFKFKHYYKKYGYFVKCKNLFSKLGYTHFSDEFFVIIHTSLSIIYI